jgi:hypothetical protein
MQDKAAPDAERICNVVAHRNHCRRVSGRYTGSRGGHPGRVAFPRVKRSGIETRLHSLTGAGAASDWPEGASPTSRFTH